MKFSIQSIVVFLHLTSLTLGAYGDPWRDIEWRDAPFMVKINWRHKTENQWYYCGGSILSLNGLSGYGVILTAGHCVADSSEIEVGIGCTSSQCGDNWSKWYEVHHFALHPGYKTNDIIDTKFDNDIAIIFLNEEITTPGACRINLCSSFHLQNGDQMDVLGYGAGGGDDTTLQHMRSIYMQNPNCVANQPQEFCFMDPGGAKTIAQGDCGGPLVHQFNQMGIISWDHPSNDPNVPQIAVSIPHYYEWIMSKFQANTLQCVEDNFGAGSAIPETVEVTISLSTPMMILIVILVLIINIVGWVCFRKTNKVKHNKIVDDMI